MAQLFKQLGSRQQKPPIHLGPTALVRKDGEVTPQQYTDEVMCQLADMLPPANHEVYPEHTLLLELEPKPHPSGPNLTIPSWVFA